MSQQCGVAYFFFAKTILGCIRSMCAAQTTSGVLCSSIVTTFYEYWQSWMYPEDSDQAGSENHVTWEVVERKKLGYLAFALGLLNLDSSSFDFVWTILVPSPLDYDFVRRGWGSVFTVTYVGPNTMLDRVHPQQCLGNEWMKFLVVGTTTLSWEKLINNYSALHL